MIRKEYIASRTLAQYSLGLFSEYNKEFSAHLGRKNTYSEM